VTADQYDDAAAQAAGAATGDPSATADPGVGSLPFTGLDLALMAVAAGALLGAGLVLRRRGASEAG
jgi:hypothetical protein